METITSLQNERVKRIVKLQRKSSVRRKEGLTVIEGRREVSRAIENGWKPTEIWICGSVSELWSEKHSVFFTSKDVFEKISYRDSSDGILAVGPLVGKQLSDLELPNSPLILIAESVEKPGNLGALMRSADGAGADALIVCGVKCDINSPNVIRNSIGTLFYLPVVETTSEEAIHFLEEKKINVFSAVPDADTIYTDCDFTGSVAIVVGAEDQGLSPVWKDKFSSVKIQMLGKNDSLNVSVCAAILLYEALRQRKV